MPIPTPPAPVVTNVTHESAELDLGASNSDFERQIEINSDDAPATIETMAGTVTSFSLTNLNAATSHSVRQRFKVPD